MTEGKEGEQDKGSLGAKEDREGEDTEDREGEELEPGKQWNEREGTEEEREHTQVRQEHRVWGLELR